MVIQADYQWHTREGASRQVNHLLWMSGSAWISAASAGIAAVISNPYARWLCVFLAVFNGLFAIYWAMMTVVANTQGKGGRWATYEKFKSRFLLPSSWLR
jgi:hypothetical protein